MGPGGPRRSVESYEILSFVDFNKKKVSKSTAAVYPFCALKRGILRGNRHMWAPPLYHFVWDFSLLNHSMNSKAESISSEHCSTPVHCFYDTVKYCQ